MILLLPGIGTKEKDLEQAVRAAINTKQTGIIINASRSIMYASQDSNFFIKARETAIKLKEEINKYRSLTPTPVEETQQNTENETAPEQQPPQQTPPLTSNTPPAPKQPESNPADLTE
jgi:hypothetical protein